MRKIILCLFFITSICFAQKPDRRDGIWWGTISDINTKYVYVIGFFDGMELGYRFSYWGIWDKDKNSSCIRKVSTSFSDYYNKYFSPATTNSQIVDGLNTFYTDYRNEKIEITDAIWIVVNSISGKSQEEIEKMTENYRKNAK